MDLENLRCPKCDFIFSEPEKKVSFEDHVLVNCPACQIVDAIKNHISQVLKMVVVNYYAPYFFELDDKSALIIDVVSSNFRQKFKQRRKHNMTLIDEYSEISFNNFYMLIASHLESIFYELEGFIHIHNIEIEKYFSDNINDKESKINKREPGYLFSVLKQNKLKIKARYKNCADFIKHASNVITHNAGVVYNKQSGKALIKKYKFRVDVPIYSQRHTLRNLGSITIVNMFELTCMVYVYLIDFVANLLSLPKLKEIKFNLVKITNDLLDMQIRKNVSNAILPTVHEECLLISLGFGFNNLDISSIQEYMKDKEKLLLIINKIKPKNVIDFEIYGVIDADKKSVKEIKRKLQNMELKALKTVRKNIKLNISLIKYRKLIGSIIEKLENIYGNDFVAQAIYSEFDRLKEKELANFILDFYRFINQKNKQEIALISRVLGTKPFQRWDPFLFGLNRPNLRP